MADKNTRLKIDNSKNSADEDKSVSIGDVLELSDNNSGGLALPLVQNGGTIGTDNSLGVDLTLSGGDGAITSSGGYAYGGAVVLQGGSAGASGPTYNYGGQVLISGGINTGTAGSDYGGNVIIVGGAGGARRGFVVISGGQAQVRAESALILQADGSAFLSAVDDMNIYGGGSASLGTGGNASITGTGITLIAGSAGLALGGIPTSAGSSGTVYTSGGVLKLVP